MLVTQLTFKCVLIDDLHESRPSLFVKKKSKRLPCKSSRVNGLVLHLIGLCQKFDFSWTSCQISFAIEK